MVGEAAPSRRSAVRTVSTPPTTSVSGVTSTRPSRRSGHSKNETGYAFWSNPDQATHPLTVANSPPFFWISTRSTTARPSPRESGEGGRGRHRGSPRPPPSQQPGQLRGAQPLLPGEVEVAAVADLEHGG